MKKKILIFIVIIIIIILSLIFILYNFMYKPKKNVMNSLNKMNISEELKGYTVDILIVGVDGKNRYNIRKRIINYNDEQYKITDFIEKKRKDYFVIGDKYYTYTARVLEEVEPFNFVNPSLYLFDLQNVKNIMISNLKENKYSFEVSSNIVKKLIEYTEVSDISLENYIDGYVIIDEDGYVSKVRYNLNENIYMLLTYSGINKVSQMIDLNNITE